MSEYSKKHVKEKVAAIKKAMKKHEKGESKYNEHKEGEYKGRIVK